MRFFKISLLLGSLLLVLTSGCQTASIQCQRETALLRAEILDLEDKYYALQSQQRRSASGSPGMVVTDNVVGGGLANSSWPVEGQMISGDVIYEDQMGGAPMMQSPIEGEVYYDGQMYGEQIYDGQVYGGQMYDGQIYDGQSLPMASPVIDSGVQSVPTPALASPDADPDQAMDLNLQDSPTVEPSIDDDQTLLLPDSDVELDVPAFEVGYEELKLDLSDSSEIDRVEIVPSATRGKDLDGIVGDDGIELMVKAINADGESVSETGELTVTVNDNLVGEIGKWTFLPKELALFQSRDESGSVGTLLHLPWTGTIPVSKQVEVRVTMMFGKIQYIATHQLEIKPPTGQASNNSVAGWTAIDDRWLSGRKPNIQTRPSPRFQSGSSTKAPATAVQRPQWKPVR